MRVRILFVTRSWREAAGTSRWLLERAASEAGIEASFCSFSELYQSQDLGELISLIYRFYEKLLCRGIDLVAFRDRQPASFFHTHRVLGVNEFLSFAGHEPQLQLGPRTCWRWDPVQLPPELFFPQPPGARPMAVNFIYLEREGTEQLMRQLLDHVLLLREERRQTEVAPLPPLMPPPQPPEAVPPIKLEAIPSDMVIFSFHFDQARQLVVGGRSRSTGRRLSLRALPPVEVLHLTCPPADGPGLLGVLRQLSWLSAAQVPKLEGLKILRLAGEEGGPGKGEGEWVIRLCLQSGAPENARARLTRHLSQKLPGRLLRFHNFDIPRSTALQLQWGLYFGRTPGAPEPAAPSILRWAIMVERAEACQLFTQAEGGRLRILFRGTPEQPTPTLADLTSADADLIFYQGTECGLGRLRRLVSDLGILVIGPEHHGFSDPPGKRIPEVVSAIFREITTRELPAQIFHLMASIGPASLADYLGGDMVKGNLLYWAELRARYAARGLTVLVPSPRTRRLYLGVPDTEGTPGAREGHGGGLLYRPEPQDPDQPPPGEGGWGGGGGGRPAGVFHLGVRELDFSHFYPSLIVHLDLSPEGEGILPGLERRLIARRLEVASAGNKALEQALKLLTNKTYGWLSRLFPQLGARVTAASQEALREAIALVEADPRFGIGARVVYGVTDSLFIRLGEGQGDPEAALSELNARMQARWGAGLVSKRLFSVYVPCTGKYHSFGQLSDGSLRVTSLQHEARNAMALTAPLMDGLLSRVCRLLLSCGTGGPFLSRSWPDLVELLSERPEEDLTEGELVIRALLKTAVPEALAGLLERGTLASVQQTEHFELRRLIHPDRAGTGGGADRGADLFALRAFRGEPPAPTLTSVMIRDLVSGSPCLETPEHLACQGAEELYLLDHAKILRRGILAPLYQALGALLGLPAKPTLRDRIWLTDTLSAVASLTQPTPLSLRLDLPSHPLLKGREQ